VKLVVGARTDVGRVREGNEDSYMVHEPLFAVADGMGGHQGGEVASKLALDTLKQVAGGERALIQAVQDANRAVFDRAGRDPGLAGMGTTLTAFLVEGDAVRLAHVGDSRAYLLRDGQLQRITKDHTVVERLVEEGRLTPQEAEIHPQRSILTRAIGVEGDVQVDQGTIEVSPGDRLLLCSDGLTGMVGEEEITRILTERSDPQAAADALIEAANEAGGQDNITAVVIDVADGGPTPAAGPSAAVTETVPTGPQGEPSPPRRVDRFPVGPPRRRRWRLLVWLLVVLVVLGGGLFAVKRLFIDRQWFVGESNGYVALYRGIPAEPLGLELATLVEEQKDLPAVQVAALAEYRNLDQGITAGDEEEARAIIAQMRQDLAAQQLGPAAP
jgi:serine/threonine protein phosphatase PrpC